MGEEFFAIYGIMFAASVVAGINYSAGGYIKNIRRHIVGDAAPMDWGKMGRAILMGVVLGIVGMAGVMGVISIPVDDGNALKDTAIVIHDDIKNGKYQGAIAAFGILVMTFTGVIYNADKYLGGRAKPNGGNGGDVPPTKFDNNLPPPKGDAA